MEYCNPLNLNYKYQHFGDRAHREGADPTLLLFKGTYYLFVSMSAGFYYSDDLMHWNWHENRSLDMYNYAPDVRQIGEYVYFCASDKGRPCTIWRSRDPLSDQWEKVSAPFDFWDPDLFCDDDGRVYLVWGSSNDQPIWGQELDRETMTPIGEKVGLYYGDKTRHGFERFNRPGKPKKKRPIKDALLHAYYFDIPGKPFLEGPFLNKLGGRYYLQYAAPDTEDAIYGDGYCVADSPLGPYTYAENSPFSSRVTGFLTGAGHGSIIEDKFGNLWHASTMCVCVNASFERRVGLFPCGVDADGLLFCNQHFADYPVTVPEGKFDPMSLKPQFMLLSYRKPVIASSAIPGHPAELAADESIRTWWCAEGCAGEWLRMDLGKVYAVHSVQINFADEGIQPLRMPPEDCAAPGPTAGRYVDSGKTLRTRWLLEGSLDGEDWFVLNDQREAETDLPHPYIVLPEGTKLRYLRLNGIERPYGSRLAISGLRVFGLGDGAKPEQVKTVQIKRKDRGMTAILHWPESKGAIGYNVRFGVAPDKLYGSYQVYSENRVKILTLNAGQEFFFAVDAFNECGVTEGPVL